MGSCSLRSHYSPALKVTSKDPEVAKAIQVHMAEHVAMMKKAKEAHAEAVKK